MLLIQWSRRFYFKPVFAAKSPFEEEILAAEPLLSSLTTCANLHSILFYANMVTGLVTEFDWS
jgi:hypothetical protein